MADPNPARTITDPENLTVSVPNHYTPLLATDPPAEETSWRPLKGFLAVLSLLALVGLFMVFIGGTRLSQQTDLTRNAPAESVNNTSVQFLEPASSRGPEEGVSEKSSRLHSGLRSPFPWSNSMLYWQRTAYHFQPEKNWMNGRFYLN